MPPITIGRDELVSSMSLDAYYEAAEAAFRAHADGRTNVPLPLHIPVDGGGFHAKGAFIELLESSGAAGRYVAVKVNSNIPGNAKRGLPTIQGAVLLYDADDGRLLAIVDSGEITSKRTAAAGALAARHLARETSSTIAICGCGEQGRAQLAAIARALPIERAFVWDIDAARATAFASEMRDRMRFEVTPVSRLEEATRERDVVVTCTSSEAAFLARGQVSPGTFIAAIGADNAHKSEIAPKLMAEAKVVVDLLAQAQTMGDLHHAIGARAMSAADVHAELGDVVTGRKPGREHADEIIVFDSTGVAIQDVAAAVWAYGRVSSIASGASASIASSR